MKKLLFFLLFPFSLFCSQTVAVIGDSIALGCGATNKKGFVQQLQERYQYENVEVLNYSYPAMTAQKANLMIDDILNEKPDYVVLAFGIADIIIEKDEDDLHDQLCQLAYKIMQSGSKLYVGKIESDYICTDAGAVTTYNNLTLMNSYRAYMFDFLTKEIITKHCLYNIIPDDTAHKIMAENLYNALNIK